MTKENFRNKVDDMTSKSINTTLILLSSLVFLAGCSQGENSEKYHKKTVENICNESPGLPENVFKDEYLKKEGKDKSSIDIATGDIDLQNAYYYYSDEDKLNCGEDESK